MSEILLIQPPQWYPVSPYLAVPLLAGQLKKAGFGVKSDENVIKALRAALTSIRENMKREHSARA